VSENAAALAGLKVLDLSRVLAGPWATQILGDLGAEVIRVEHPTQPDSTRGWGPPFFEQGREPWDAAYYLCANRNKQAIAIDFGKPAGLALVKQLAAQADILVENYKVGTLARSGLDYASLKAANPRLIYCSITGFGQTGPYAARGGYDFLIQGMSGLMSVTGHRQGEANDGPLKVGVPVSDLFCGLYATIAILAALNHRHASGEGQHIDASLLDSQVALLANQAMNYLVGGRVPERLGNGHPNVVPYRDFVTADGRILLACGGDNHFQAVCRLLGRPDLAEDERYRCNAGRTRNREELEGELARSFKNWKSADLLAAFDEAGIPGGPINTLEQILDDPQIRARELLQSATRDDGSAVPYLQFPLKLSATPARCRRAPPRFAQDTAAVLKEHCRLSEADIAALEQAGVIKTNP